MGLLLLFCKHFVFLLLQGGYPKKGSWYEGMEYGKNTSMNVFFYGSRTEKANPDYSYQVQGGL